MIILSLSLSLPLALSASAFQALSLFALLISRSVSLGVFFGIAFFPVEAAVAAARCASASVSV